MSDPTIETPTAYVRFTRKRPTEQYGSAEVSLSLPIEVPDGELGEAFFKKAADLVDAAKVEVLNALNIEFEVDAEGRIAEKALAPLAPAPPATGAAAVANAFPGATNACPECGGAMWDNREGKRNPKAPDFKCKDKSCDGVIWPPRK